MSELHGLNESDLRILKEVIRWYRNTAGSGSAPSRRRRPASARRARFFMIVAKHETVAYRYQVNEVALDSWTETGSSFADKSAEDELIWADDYWHRIHGLVGQTVPGEFLYVDGERKLVLYLDALPPVEYGNPTSSTFPADELYPSLIELRVVGSTELVLCTVPNADDGLQTVSGVPVPSAWPLGGVNTNWKIPFIRTPDVNGVPSSFGVVLNYWATQIMYGKLTADWDPLSPQTVTVNPCRHDGGQPGTDEVTVYLYEPAGNAGLTPNLSAGDVMTFVYGHTRLTGHALPYPGSVAQHNLLDSNVHGDTRIKTAIQGGMIVGDSMAKWSLKGAPSASNMLLVSDMSRDYRMKWSTWIETGTGAGELLYWDPSVQEEEHWNNLALGSNGQVLSVDTAQASNLAWTTIIGLPGGAQGDLLTYDSGSWSSLTIGSNGEIIEVVGGALTWVTKPAGLPSGSFGDALVCLGGTTWYAATGVGGSLFYHNGTWWTSLAPGVSGQILTIHPTVGHPFWDAPADLDLMPSGSSGDMIVNNGGADYNGWIASGGTTGDIWYYNGSAWAKLAIGVTGDFLSVLAGVPNWEAIDQLPASDYGGSVLVGTGDTLWEQPEEPFYDSVLVYDELADTTDWVERGFWAEIDSSASDGDNRWKYAWHEIEKTSAGYGGWANKTGGRSGTTVSDPCRNTIEDMNGASGILGNGVDADNLGTADWTFTLQPAPAGVIVWMEAVPLGSGGPEYWFAYENGVDGQCGEPA